MNESKITINSDCAPGDTILGRVLTAYEREYASSKLVFEVLGISTRGGNALKVLHCRTLLDAAVLPMRKLLSAKNVGAKTITELKAALRESFEPKSIELAIKSEGSGNTTEAAIDVALVDTCLGRELRADELEFAHSFLIQNMGLSTRALNILTIIGCRTAFDVATCSLSKVRRAKGSGQKTMSEISNSISEIIQKQSRRPLLSPNAARNEILLRETHRLYEVHGTLQAVGKIINLSRERVRQLLVRGAKAGLFNYDPRDPLPDFGPEKLLADYRRLGSVQRVAKENSLKRPQLMKLLQKHGITSENLDLLRQDHRRMKCVDEFRAVAEILGHYPTATELQQMPGRKLYARITHNWGSIDALRDFMSIPRPPQGNPNFAADVRKWREDRSRLSQLAMTENSEAILKCLRDAGS